MKNTEKVTLSTIMTMNYDDFYDLVSELLDGKYGVEDDYGDLHFVKYDEDGNEIEDYDEDEITDNLLDKLSEYFDVTVCNFRLISEYDIRDVVISYID